jgi:hypothetical protein
MVGMIRARARFDLTDTERPDRRLAQLLDVPDGGTAEVIVGVLAPDPMACRRLAEHADRLEIVVVGMPTTVARWLDLVRDPDILALGVVAP